MCVYEAYGVIKRKWKKHHLNDDQYINAMYFFSSLIRNNFFQIVDAFVENIEDFRNARSLVERHVNNNGKRLIDLSDALQISLLKKGFYSLLGGESKPVLFTADKKFKTVAEKEGLQVELFNVK